MALAGFLIVSMPWLFEFVQTFTKYLPQDLNAEVITEKDNIKLIVLYAEEVCSLINS